MIGRRSVIGLSLLCALLFSAFAAQSASAALTTSKNTTAFTCVSKASGGFSDSHCDTTASPGTFGHELITTAGTEVDTTNTTNAVLKGEVVGGGKVTITCTTVKNKTVNSTLTNSSPGALEHTLEGKAETEFKTCTVTELKNCTVDDPIVSKATVHGVEGMEGPNKEANAMGLEFIGSGANETFTEVTFRGASCAVKDTTFPIKGKVIATGGTAKQDSKHSGATLVFTNANAMEELTLGGKTSTFTLTATATMAGGGSPISATTTT